MIEKPLDVLTAFPVRKSKAQKQAFRDAVQRYFSGLGYESRVEKGSFGARNLVIGDPENARFLITAHYDTCARMVVPNLITPCNIFLFLGCQLLIALLLLLPGALLGAVIGCFSRMVGFWVFFLVTYLGIFLMMFGPANPSNVNDNSSGVVTLLEIAGSLPENQRRKVCFVLFDLEEAGLLGSAAYRKQHRQAVSRQIVLNLDCVGEGEEILFFPTGKLKKDKQKLALLRPCCGRFGSRRVTLREKGFSIYPSDQANFPYGVGICALRRGKLGLYLSRIHTPKDKVLDQTNVNILRAGICTLVSQAPEE